MICFTEHQHQRWLSSPQTLSTSSSMSSMCVALLYLPEIFFCFCSILFKFLHFILGHQPPRIRRRIDCSTGYGKRVGRFEQLLIRQTENNLRSHISVHLVSVSPISTLHSFFFVLLMKLCFALCRLNAPLCSSVGS